MRAIWIALLLPCLTCAQAAAPSASPPDGASLVRGVLLECDARPAGEFSIRAADNRVLLYQFDPKTYAERETHLIEPARLVAGEQIEVLSDALTGHPLPYARTIHVLQSPPPPRPQTAARRRTYDLKSEQTVRTGNLTFAGVVFRLNSQRLAIHTRQAGDQYILLRADTRYLAGGQLVDAAFLKPNMRVFVRAGRDIYNDVEAYQVIWGAILTPR